MGTSRVAVAREPKKGVRPEYAVSALAWAQLLVLLSALDKNEMRALFPWLPGTHSPVTLWNWIGFAALTLNAAALAFLLIALLAVDDDRKKELWLRQSNDTHRQGFFALGGVTWFMSLLLSLAYFNPFIAVIAFLTVIGAIVHAARLQKKFRPYSE